MDSPISLRIQELSADEIESGIEQGQLHLGIGFVPPASPMLEAEPLLEENLVLIVPTSHRLAGQQMMFCHQLKQSRRMG